MKTFSFILFIPFLFLFFSCSSEHEFGSPEMGFMADSAAAVSSTAMGTSRMKAELVTAHEDGSKIQVNGSLTLEVDDVEEAAKMVRQLVLSHEGRITNSDTGSYEQRYTNMTLLVPSSKFYSIIAEIKKISVLVSNENIYSNDVTEEYIDTEARLNVMKGTEDRFLVLLQDTRNIDEAIKVEKELMRIRGEIDSLQGRMNYFVKTTANSMLNLRMVESVPITGDQWNAKDSVSDSLRNLVSFFKHIADFFIWVLIFSPVIGIIGVITYFLYKLTRRLIRRQNKLNT
ncbi:MAG: DUF4349 domain-containing protein [SAR202 cluster bacterium]|jgi:hypothetical protein|nr:DUF4349 domain-containing protein [SAR202 cluster bacterium]MQG74363.1 DUF4349 domain-containing protein [SAR202 cluster bacterium]|tara:strand:- start:1397 stop:2254 length:858 start_codon:yes stop_codon:yes gene_type:complete